MMEPTPIRRMKSTGDAVYVTLGRDDAEGDGPPTIHVIPVAAAAARAALLGLDPVEGLAVCLRERDAAANWPAVYRGITDGDPAPIEEAREVLGVEPGAALTPVAHLVQLQPGRVEEIADVIDRHGGADTDVAPEDVAWLVQLGDLTGKAQRYLGTPEAVAAVDMADAAVQGMCERGGVAA